MKCPHCEREEDIANLILDEDFGYPETRKPIHSCPFCGKKMASNYEEAMEFLQNTNPGNYQEKG